MTRSGACQHKIKQIYDLKVTWQTLYQVFDWLNPSCAKGASPVSSNYFTGDCVCVCVQKKRNTIIFITHNDLVKRFY